jgi:hypothetical protein
MKEEILQKLGKNHKNTLELLKSKKSEPYGLYTYRGEIYLLNDGKDILWENITNVEQLNIYNQIISND